MSDTSKPVQGWSITLEDKREVALYKTPTGDFTVIVKRPVNEVGELEDHKYANSSVENGIRTTGMGLTLATLEAIAVLYLEHYKKPFEGELLTLSSKPKP